MAVVSSGHPMNVCCRWIRTVFTLTAYCVVTVSLSSRQFVKFVCPLVDAAGAYIERNADLLLCSMPNSSQSFLSY